MDSPQYIVPDEHIHPESQAAEDMVRYLLNIVAPSPAANEAVESPTDLQSVFMLNIKWQHVISQSLTFLSWLHKTSHVIQERDCYEDQGCQIFLKSWRQTLTKSSQKGRPISILHL